MNLDSIRMDDEDGPPQPRAPGFAPTPEQAAIISTIKAGNHVMVNALAGCAKTSTIVLAANALPMGVDAIALAFNKKIAVELQEKLPTNVEAMTLNSMGHRAWAKGRARLRVDGRKNWKMIDAIMKAQNLALSRGENLLAVQAMGRIKSIGAVPPLSFKPPRCRPLRNWDNEMWTSLEDWFEEPLNALTRQVIGDAMTLSIKEAFQGFIDFDDQIYMPVIFGGSFPSPHAMFVDEAQDLNAMNHRMIALCKPQQLVVVGDRHQAIYAFRGALANSMDAILDGSCGPTDWTVLPLTQTFRCGKAIVERQLGHVPQYKAAPSNPPGTILEWDKWSVNDIPPRAAVICRNNAPLMPVALALLAEGKPCTILGRDFMASLTKDINKAAPENCDIATLASRLLTYFNLIVAKFPGKAAQLEDRRLAILAAGKGAHDRDSLLSLLDRLFSDTKANITLCTGHKAKGLEWDFVVHLDPHLIGKFAKAPDEITQEANLRYVIETRPRHTLAIATSKALAERNEVEDTD